MKPRVAMAEQDWMGAGEYLQQAVVIVEKFEVLVAAWQVHATAWQFYRGTKEDKTGEASGGRAEAFILKISNSFARDGPLRASLFFPPPVARVLRACTYKRAGY